MIRFFFTVFFLMIPSLLFFSKSQTEEEQEPPYTAETYSIYPSWQNLYEELELDGRVSRNAFQQAITGYYKIDNRRKEILTLIDFSKASTEERLFVIDMKQHKLLFSSVVAHGRNSGENYATSFSNKSGSYKSSLGFYLTNETYNGSNGYSLRLDGLEKGINDNARERAIVMHGAAYAHPSTACSGRLGRSFGCPAIPPALTRPIIDTIKDGSVMFIYAPQKEYMAKSNFLKKGETYPPIRSGTGI